MLNPYILLAFALALAGTNWWSYNHGLSVAEGEQAARDLLVANAYLEATGRNAAAELKAAEDRLRRSAERKAASASASHQLELELARDEAARTCRVSDATLGVLNRAIDAANSAATAIPVGRNGAASSAAQPERSDRAGTGSMDRPGGEAVRAVP